MSMPLHVAATLDSAACGVEGNPLPLDGLLAWAMHAREHDPTPPRGSIKDYLLPVEQWEACGTWGWKTSRAHPHILARTSLQLRRRPPDWQLAVYTKERKNHHGLDAWKARDLTVPASIIDTIEWDLQATDPDQVEDLLHSISHIGSHRADGCGHVARWDITPGDPEAWKDRPMPQQGQTGRFRPPYWSDDRTVTC
ncbi:hypothetical protein BACT_1084 [Bifidobacterium actinocoloniiforme DSM 22766]|uniref:Uncharacterized protein n=1 Tax=Bifidobacterium actinocoloniiforme DSM 22766 TaxID=1437605 RepID=A0A086Z1I2_9BIFI|nr:hypothetical protein [Bifidobacterium actinocoloniiforme]AKV55520.1 hypothetical protein AB656_04035 [Bifidobacterium actinocoloniiforme DSM 22766]KFI40382.1 hypothetical protein BACT_1084 [Bifidobacterium actinocoloniiforme DSM 22766]